MTLVAIVAFSGLAMAQGQDSVVYGNTRLQNFVNNEGLTVGGYAQVDYNQLMKEGMQPNAALDVHRLVLFLGYTFNNQLSFISEIEYEHANEIWVEQAYLNYRVARNFSFNAGLMLIPMGIVNQYHEPPTFHGVERTFVDKYIVPTTWREIGIGFQGRIQKADIKYLFNLTNGLMGYDGEARFNGSSGLRGGRQKASKAQMQTPVVNGRLEYYGLPGLKIGFSGYFGDSQSTLWNSLDTQIDENQQAVDSSVVRISMLGLDVVYRYKTIQLKGQFIHTNLANTEAYNAFGDTDLGSSHFGGFAEVAWNFLPLMSDDRSQQLWIFARAENFNTHQTTQGIELNSNFNRYVLTTGLTFLPNEGVSLKADYQWLTKDNGANKERILNLGVGVWF